MTKEGNKVKGIKARIKWKGIKWMVTRAENDSILIRNVQFFQ